MAHLKELSCIQDGVGYKTESVQLLEEISNIQFDLAELSDIGLEYSVDDKTFVKTDFAMPGAIGSNMIEICSKRGVFIRVASSKIMSNIKILL